MQIINIKKYPKIRSKDKEVRRKIGLRRLDNYRKAKLRSQGLWDESAASKAKLKVYRKGEEPIYNGPGDSPSCVQISTEEELRRLYRRGSEINPI